MVLRSSRRISWAVRAGVGLALALTVTAPPGGVGAAPPDPPTFADVAPDHRFFDAIQWMGQTGTSTGTAQPDGLPLFHPGHPVSRQALAAFLHRYAGSPSPAPTGSVFADVAPDHAFFDAIQWMGQTGTSTGTAQPDGLPLFKPTQPVERQALAAFLYRHAGSPPVDPWSYPAFYDVEPDHTFATAIEWMGRSRLADGSYVGYNYESGTAFLPTEPLGRDAAAAFLHRLSRLRPFVGCDGAVGVPEHECDALLALYHATDLPGRGGPLVGWLLLADVCQWGGVTCSDGHVAELDVWAAVGPLPPEIGDLDHLVDLELRGDLSGTSLPSELGDLRALRSLDLVASGLSGLPPEIGQLDALEELGIYNQTDLAVPPEIGDLESLRHLGLTDVVLAGLPPEIGRLPALETMYVTGATDGGRPVGSIPSAIGELATLRTLEISLTALAGPLPASLGGLVHLETVMVRWNDLLTGPLPQALGDLPHLSTLWITGNPRLGGAIPSSIDHLTGLRSLDLSSNQLHGPVPGTLHHLELDDLSLHSNGCLTAASTELAEWLSGHDRWWDHGCR